MERRIIECVDSKQDVVPTKRAGEYSIRNDKIFVKFVTGKISLGSDTIYTTSSPEFSHRKQKTEGEMPKCL